MNELILVKKMEERLKIPRKETVFPLTPTHRKELRQLRDKNIGELRSRLRILKKTKRDEFIETFRKKLEEKTDELRESADQLNDSWRNIVKQINEILQRRVRFEEKFKEHIKWMQLEVDYGMIAELKKIDAKRLYSINIHTLASRLGEEEFNKKFSKAFEETDKKIELLVTMYEEAINFGDLEIVKEIYYKLKEADQFLEKLAKLKVKK